MSNPESGSPSIADMVDGMQRLLRTSARMYMCLTRATLDAFGRDGEMTVRRGLRAYGEWRGSEMRQAHHALGLDIDMKTLLDRWDNASTFIVKDDIDASGIHEPDDYQFDVTLCPAAQAWKEAGFDQWGHVYCDEFHQACASAYHPDGNVVIPINMMKGDDRCHFRWIMPGGVTVLDMGAPTAFNHRLAESYKADTDDEAARKALLRSNRLVGGRYVTAARAILADFGDDGLGVVREGMRAWGQLRGEILRREHEKRGHEINTVSLMRQRDFPCATVWDMAETEATPAPYAAQIRWTPQDEAWRDMDALDLGEHWYGAAMGAMVEAYLPGARIAWPRLQCRGDAVSEIEIAV
jgi:hypothetical protein